MIKNLYRSSYKVPAFLSDFNETCFLDSVSKNTQMSNFVKIRPVGAELFHADRRTDGRTDTHEEVNSRFSQFFKRTYKHFSSLSCVTQNVQSLTDDRN